MPAEEHVARVARGWWLLEDIQVFGLISGADGCCTRAGVGRTRVISAGAYMELTGCQTGGSGTWSV